MASAAMAECGCGSHPYHDNKEIDGNAYVRCASHSSTRKKEAYPMTPEGAALWKERSRGVYAVSGHAAAGPHPQQEGK